MLVYYSDLLRPSLFSVQVKTPPPAPAAMCYVFMNIFFHSLGINYNFIYLYCPRLYYSITINNPITVYNYEGVVDLSFPSASNALLLLIR